MNKTLIRFDKEADCLDAEILYSAHRIITERKYKEAGLPVPEDYARADTSAGARQLHWQWSTLDTLRLKVPNVKLEVGSRIYEYENYQYFKVVECNDEYCIIESSPDEK